MDRVTETISNNSKMSLSQRISCLEQDLQSTNLKLENSMRKTVNLEEKISLNLAQEQVKKLD